MTVKNADYYQGVREEEARQAAKALGINPAALAREVARNFARDEASKRRILLSASPQLAYSLDAGELEQMSARELATHELKGYGIKVSDSSDPVEVRDAFHAGRMHERQRQRGSAQDAHWRNFSGQTMDGSDLEGTDFVSRYTRGEK